MTRFINEVRIRVLAVGAALVGAVSGGLVANSSFAGTPDHGRLTSHERSTSWHGSFEPGADYAVQLAAAQAVTEDELTPVCPPEQADPAHQVCDHYRLDVAIPPAYWKAHPRSVVQITVAWDEPSDSLEAVAYDPAGRRVADDYTEDPMSLTLSRPTGTYEIVVLPLLSPKPTNWTARAAVVELPRTPAHPSVGGPQTYRAEPVTADRVTPATPLPNRAPAVTLSARSIGALTIEPTVGMSPKGALFLHAARPKGEGSVAGGSLYGYPPTVRMSRDLGRHWSDVTTPDVKNFQNSTNDPYIYVDQVTGRVFWLNLGYFFGSELSYTDDEGKSWTNTLLNGAGVDDRPTIATGRVPDGVTLPTLDPAFPRIVYYCVNGIVATGCTRSLDGGRVFHKIASPLLDQASDCPGSGGKQTGHLSTDPAGRVFVAAANCGPVEVAVSEDAGMSWTTSRVSSHYSTAHTVDVVSDAAGNLYVLWTESATRTPLLSTSRDHGRTWSTPVAVAPPGLKDEEMITLTAGAPGHVAVGMLGTTVPNAADTHRPWAYYLAVTTDALDARPVFQSNSAVIADTGSRVVARGDCCAGLHDFLDMQVSPTDGEALGTLGVPCPRACQLSDKGINDASFGSRTPGYIAIQTGGPRPGRRTW